MKKTTKLYEGRYVVYGLHKPRWNGDIEGVLITDDGRYFPLVERATKSYLPGWSVTLQLSPVVAGWLQFCKDRDLPPIGMRQLVKEVFGDAVDGKFFSAQKVVQSFVSFVTEAAKLADKEDLEEITAFTDAPLSEKFEEGKPEPAAEEEPAEILVTPARSDDGKYCVLNRVVEILDANGLPPEEFLYVESDDAATLHAVDILATFGLAVEDEDVPLIDRIQKRYEKHEHPEVNIKKQTPKPEQYNVWERALEILAHNGIAPSEVLFVDSDELATRRASALLKALHVVASSWHVEDDAPVLSEEDLVYKEGLTWKWLDDHKLAVYDLARESGVSAATIVRVIKHNVNGFKYTPKAETVQKLTEAMRRIADGKEGTK